MSRRPPSFSYTAPRNRVLLVELQLQRVPQPRVPLSPAPAGRTRIGASLSVFFTVPEMRRTAAVATFQICELRLTKAHFATRKKSARARRADSGVLRCAVLSAQRHEDLLATTASVGCDCGGHQTDAKQSERLRLRNSVRGIALAARRPGSAIPMQKLAEKALCTSQPLPRGRGIRGRRITRIR